MSTSLAEQLQRLAVPQTSNLTRDKKRASFLFEPKVAANLGKEAVFELAFDGFEELLSRNHLFAPFQHSIFHASSKEFERSVHTADENKKLNKVIKRFLLLLSPYFLTHGAHATLEWLIHRYHIHQYNTEDLLMLILPYHETNYFVRAIQIINFKNAVKWRWLKPLQKPGIHLNKQMLYNHASSDPYLIQIISNHVLYAIKEHDKVSDLSIIFSFYGIVFVGALDVAKNINEAMVSQLLPVVLKGLSSDYKEFSAPSYIIVSKLVQNNQFATKLLNSFVKKISSNTNNLMHKEQMLLLVLIYQTQQNYKTIPDEAVKNLYDKGFVGQHLEYLRGFGCVIQPFLVALFQGAVKIALEGEDYKSLSFVDDLLKKLNFDDAFVPILLDVIFEQYQLIAKPTEENASWIKSVIQNIEQQKPTAFDNAIKALSPKTSSFAQREKLKCFHRIVQNVKVLNREEVFEKLYHPLPEMRKSMINVMIEKYPSLNEPEQVFVQKSLMDRLNDDDHVVVDEILRSGNRILAKIIETEELIVILLNIIEKAQVQLKTAHLALKLITDIAPADDIRVFLIVLPFLLEVKSKMKKILTASRFIQSNSLLKTIADGGDLFQLLSKGNFDFTSVLRIFMEKSVGEQSIAHQFLRLIILCQATKTVSNDLRLLVLYIIQTHLENDATKYCHGEDTVSNYLQKTKLGQMPIQGLLLCLEQLILNMQKLETPLEATDFYLENIHNEFCLKLLIMLLKGCNSKKQNVSTAYWRVLIVFLERFCSKNKIEELLLNVACTQSVFVNDKAKILIIKTLLFILNKKHIFDDNLLKLNCAFVPYVLVSLQSTNEAIRHSMYAVIDIVTSASTSDDNYGFLVNGLAKNRGEISLDHSQVPIMVNKLLTTSRKVETRKVLHSLLGLLENETIPVCLKRGIVEALHFVDDVEVYTKLSIFGSQILANEATRNNDEESSIIRLIISQFSEQIAAKVSETGPIWDFLHLTTKDDKSTIKFDSDVSFCPSILMMNQIDHVLYGNFNVDVQNAFLETIVTVVACTLNPEVTSVASKFFKHIDLDANSILQLLIAMRDVQSPKLDQTKLKRRRTLPLPTTDILDELSWKKGVVILEFIQDKKKIKNVEKIMTTLFEVLKKCLDFPEQANVEYPKQLILSSILHCCDKLENVKIQESVFNMELVVQCIRASQNPQTHHHALLLLARATQFTPTQVLHHIMAIFTFMGSSVLRHDDAYSFQIITKIIDTIIPILVKDGDKESVRKVLRVFVDVILDVPDHRRMPLYRQLITQIGPKENLHIFMLLSLEAQVLHTNTEKGQSTQKRVDILKKLCHEFQPDILIGVCSQLLQYVRALPENKEECTDSVDFIFDVRRNTPKQFRHYKYTIILFTSKLIQSAEFVKKIAALNDEQTMSMEGAFKEMIIHILTYIQSTSKVAERNANGPQGQYWKIVLHHSYDILDGLNALLTAPMFLLVIKGLMTHTLATVRRRAMELLNAKIQHNAEFFKDVSDGEMYAMIPPLIEIIKGIDDDLVSDECVVIIQTAFLSLKLFVKLLAKDEPEKFVKILNFVADIIYTNKCTNSNILASAILCCAELSHKLHAHAIPNLSKFMHSLIKILKQQKLQEAPNLLLMSALTSIQKLFDCLALFLSPFLEKLLCELANLTSNWVLDENDAKVTPFISKLASIKQKIGTSIPPRVLIPTIDSSYKQLIEKRNYKSISALMDILCEHLKHFPILEHIPELTIFFLDALQFRSQNNTTLDIINIVEADIIKALLCLTLKLSESTFRPFYYKLYDWAVRNNDQRERIITFYALSAGISKSLKGLFVLFAGHIINNVSTILDACNQTKSDQLYFSKDEHNVMLLENALETLNHIFMSDGQKFVNKDRFDVLMQPIVDQLDNTLGADVNKRINALVIPCIVNFAVATGDDALWKQMNYQVLLKMRDSNLTIRLTGLRCLVEVAKKLGEDFLPLLPETIPFLAELLEDEEEVVEKACQKAVQELEKVLGEPLQKYF